MSLFKAKRLTSSLPEIEIEAALAAFREPGALCYVRPSTTNQGLSAEFSFNSPSWTGPSGMLRVALREAIVEIAAVSSDWTWSQDFVDTVKSLGSPVTEASTKGTSQIQSDQATVEGKFNAKTGVNLLAMKTHLGGQLIAKVDTGHNDSISDSITRTINRVSGHMKLQRHSDRFFIEFRALEMDDLGDLNADINRTALIDISEPATVDLGKINITLKTQIDDGESIRHAFQIKLATGAWRPLGESQNKRILGELLLSKFLVPLHAPIQLWPVDTGSKG